MFRCVVEQLSKRNESHILFLFRRLENLEVYLAGRVGVIAIDPAHLNS